jgi:hypothetical protein
MQIWGFERELRCPIEVTAQQPASTTYCEAKIIFQSFFMLITVQPLVLASSYKAWVKVPTLVSGRLPAGP